MAGVSRSGLHSWRSKPPKVKCPDECMIERLFVNSKEKLGYRQLKMRFERKTGCLINLKKVRRIKRDLKLVTKIRRRSKFKAIFKEGEQSSVAPNLVRRNFTSSKEAVIWSTDMTELHFAYGQKAYLSVFKELGSNRIMSHRVGSRPTIDLAIGDLVKELDVMGWQRRKVLTVHSDQGFQYTSWQFRKMLESWGVKQSMSRKGNCLDNAPVESFFGHLKDEVDVGGCRSLDEVRLNIKKYVRYYNEERPQWGLEKRTPAEAGVLKGLVY